MVPAWNPLVPAHDADVVLENFAGCELHEGVLMDCKKKFFEKLIAYSRKMRRGSWYDGSNHQLFKEVPTMANEVIDNRTRALQNNSPPPKNTRESLVVDTNVFYGAYHCPRHPAYQQRSHPCSHGCLGPLARADSPVLCTDLCKKPEARRQGIEENGLLPREKCFEELKILLQRQPNDILIVVPNAVLKELDKFKSGKTNKNQAARSSAAFIEETAGKNSAAFANEEDPKTVARNNLRDAELARDEPAKVLATAERDYAGRLANESSDDQIIARAAARAKDGKCVLLTTDRIMRTKAEAQDLDVLELNQMCTFLHDTNGEGLSRKLPSDWVERLKRRAEEEGQAHAAKNVTQLPSGWVRGQTSENVIYYLCAAAQPLAPLTAAPCLSSPSPGLACSFRFGDAHYYVSPDNTHVLEGHTSRVPAQELPQLYDDLGDPDNSPYAMNYHVRRRDGVVIPARGAGPALQAGFSAQ